MTIKWLHKGSFLRILCSTDLTTTWGVLLIKWWPAGELIRYTWLTCEQTNGFLLEDSLVGCTIGAMFLLKNLLFSLGWLRRLLTWRSNYNRGTIALELMELCLLMKNLWLTWCSFGCKTTINLNFLEDLLWNEETIQLKHLTIWRLVEHRPYSFSQEIVLQSHSSWLFARKPLIIHRWQL